MEKFKKSEVFVNTVPTGKTYTLRKDIKSLVATKTEGGNFDFIDDYIVNYFGDIIFADTRTAHGRLRYLTDDMTHHDIIHESTYISIYQEYALGDSLLLANRVALSGIVNQPGCGVIIYLKERINNCSYRLHISCSQYGKLHLYICKVLDRKWPTGYAVLFND